MSSVFFYEPFSDFDRLFEEAFAARSGGSQFQRQRLADANSSTVMRPKMDLHENTKSNTVTASYELPGLKKEDVQININNGRLTVSAENKHSSDYDEEGYAVRERRFGKFSRTLQLPQGVKAEEIKASMDHGVLAVTFPKLAPDMAPKRIAIA